MIHTGQEAPRWIRELARFLPLKNLIFIHGNIYDLINYPVEKPSGEVYWTESTHLEHFLERYLMDCGYEVVGIGDPIDGIYFPKNEMRDTYRKLTMGKTVVTGTQDKPLQEPESDKKVSQKRLFPNDPLVLMDGVKKCMENTTVPCAFVINYASRLVSDSSHLSTPERQLMARIQKAMMQSRIVIRENQRWSNVLILIVDKLNDIPPFLYLNNPRGRSVFINQPDYLERQRFIRRNYPYFYQAKPEGPNPETLSLFPILTEGLSLYEMKSLIHLSMCEKIPIEDPITHNPRINNICEMYKYGIIESEWDKIDRQRLEQADSFIHQRIKGQESAVHRVLDIIKRARIGLAAGSSTKQNRPKGVLFFAGPTGVGKTEMAKTLATLLFGDEDRCIRFDMSEYSAEQSDQRLLGAPPGYVGYEEGGQLTNLVKNNPFSVLLFDEIEKAHRHILDKFLQILEDGRLTDGKGETVYFSESIIIFTSNLGTVSRSSMDQSGVPLVNPEMDYSEIQNRILESIREHFIFELGRPEILNRMGDNFVVFDYIRPPVDQEIINLFLHRLAASMESILQLQIVVMNPVKERLTALCQEELQYGGRGIRNVFDSVLVNPLNRFIFDTSPAKGSTLVLQQLLDSGTPNTKEYSLDIHVDPV